MRDGPLRSVVKRALAWSYLRWLEAGRRRRPLLWDLGGACEGCGACCERPTIAVGALVHAPVSRALFLWWQRVVNGFVDAVVDQAAGTVAFRCTHFDPATRRCDSYASRPGMCRDYPRMLLAAPTPDLFAQCGHRAVDDGADALVAALKQNGVDGAALVQIEKKLKGERASARETARPS